MSLLIGLAAKARSGKDTVANLLLAQNPLLAAYALADPVKMGCEVLFGLGPAQAWTDDSKRSAYCPVAALPQTVFPATGNRLDAPARSRSLATPRPTCAGVWTGLPPCQEHSGLLGLGAGSGRDLRHGA